MGLVGSVSRAARAGVVTERGCVGADELGERDVIEHYVVFTGGETDKSKSHDPYRAIFIVKFVLDHLHFKTFILSVLFSVKTGIISSLSIQNYATSHCM